MNYCLWINTRPPSLPKLSTHHLCSTFLSSNVCITLPAMGEDFSSQLTDVTQNKVDLLMQFEIQFSVYPYKCCSPTDWPNMPEPPLKLPCKHWGAIHWDQIHAPPARAARRDNPQLTTHSTRHTPKRRPASPAHPWRARALAFILPLLLQLQTPTSPQSQPAPEGALLFLETSQFLWQTFTLN